MPCMHQKGSSLRSAHRVVHVYFHKACPTPWRATSIVSLENFGIPQKHYPQCGCYFSLFELLEFTGCQTACNLLLALDSWWKNLISSLHARISHLYSISTMFFVYSIYRLYPPNLLNSVYFHPACLQPISVTSKVIIEEQRSPACGTSKKQEKVYSSSRRTHNVCSTRGHFSNRPSCYNTFAHFEKSAPDDSLALLSALLQMFESWLYVMSNTSGSSAEPASVERHSCSITKTLNQTCYMSSAPYSFGIFLYADSKIIWS